jgi:DNA-binding transcriptional ArsR family regulator
LSADTIFRAALRQHGGGKIMALAWNSEVPDDRYDGATARGRAATGSTRPDAEAGWTFLTNHAHVLLSIAGDPEIRIRDVALRVGITERAVQRIVADLEEQGYLTISKEGRRNRYEVHLCRPLRHPIEAHHTVEALIGLVERKGCGELGYKP